MQAMRSITRNIVGAFVFSSDDKVLLGLHDPNGGGAYAGFWVIPGGGVDEGETPVEALRRECMEEAGLDISSCEAKLFDDSQEDEREKTLKDTGERVSVKMRFLDYEVHIDKRADEVSTHESDELIELKWVTLAELTNTKLPPLTRAAFKRQGYIHD
jgi:8-oxo-dGTP pyrophosphatase MutT (NUDIX family)